MTLDDWLDHARADADRRGLPELRPLLEALARAATALRRADWLDDAAGATPDAVDETRPVTRDQ